MLRVLVALFVCTVAWAQQPQGRVSQEDLPEAVPNRQESSAPRGAATRPPSPEPRPPSSSTTAQPESPRQEAADDAPQADQAPTQHSPAPEEQERGRAGKPVAAFWTVILRR